MMNAKTALLAKDVCCGLIFTVAQKGQTQIKKKTQIKKGKQIKKEKTQIKEESTK